MAEQRLASEFRTLTSRIPVGVGAEPVSSSNMLNWEGVILGPRGTPFQGGAFKIKMEFPSSYPSSPPTVYFVSKMFHPNIYDSGKVCMGILNPTSWSSEYDIVYILNKLVALLQTPNPSSPANPEAANLYRDNRSCYENRVRQCARSARG